MIDVIDEYATDDIIDTVIITPDDDGNWSYHWDNLPIMTSDGSTEALYYVEETPVDQYTTVYVSPDGSDYDDPMDAATAIDSDAKTEINVSNTHEPLLVNINAQKEWDDDDNQYGLRDEDVILTLEYSIDGGNTWSQAITENTAVADRPSPADDDGKTVYSASENQQIIYGEETDNIWTGAIWDDLSAYALNEDGESCKVIYRVVENDEDVPLSYTTTASDTASYDEGAEETQYLAVTNKLTDVVKYTVTKTWEMGSDIVDPASVQPDYITVQLQYAEKDDDGNITGWVDVPKNGEAKLTPETAKDGTITWTSYTWENLRADLEYRAVEVSATWTAGGKEQTVYVKDELGLEARTEKGTVGSFEYTAEKKFDEEKAQYTTTLTNSLPETTFTVHKTWDDENNKDGLRTPVTVNLYRDGKTLIATATLSAENNWSYTWKNLPMYQNGSDTAKSVYTVEEVKVNGYEETKYSANNVSFDGNGSASVEITNKHVPETSPNTGDNTDFDTWTGILALAVILMLGSGFMAFRKREEE